MINVREIDWFWIKRHRLARNARGEYRAGELDRAIQEGRLVREVRFIPSSEDGWQKQEVRYRDVQ